jgi:ubiquinone/menaquinone biosynthesis C-methylase UbiE
MDSASEQEAYFAEVSSEYADSYTNPRTIMDHEKVHRLQVALSLAPLDDSERVLNVGVGGGELAQFVPPSLHERIVGFDFSRAMIEQARRRRPDGTFVQGVVQDIPLGDEAVDTVLCLGVVGYLDPAELRQAIEELYRVSDVTVVLSFANAASPFRRVRQGYYYVFLDTLKRLSGLGEPLTHRYRSYDPETVIELLEAAGFSVTDRAYLTYSSGLSNTPIHRRLYQFFERRLSESDRAGPLAMTWVVKAEKRDHDG